MTSSPRPDPGQPAPGADPFHEPRRDDCPWCGSRSLRTRVRAPEGMRRMPGTFVVDECHDCSHAFQNPRPTPDGLLLRHHRYPTEGDIRSDLAGRLRRRHHRIAARAMLPYPEPESWLDVGTGHGYFPEAARDIHPYTAFDGLDPTPRVERARAAGRVEEAHQGLLTDPAITARLRARYDVVSMFHHLEHTADPRAELRAARTVLRPDGHLLVEVPDPVRPFGSLPIARRWPWKPYDRPRPLHLMPLRNLLAELEYLGYRVITTRPCAPFPPRAHRIIARRTALPDAPMTSPTAPTAPPPPPPHRPSSAP
ncbi:class I SAM-dependent methyltransferase [Streptomyces ipomoeae]|uniref:Methyltransferase domain protein n=4 Tax=Streptomyces ipomoeae TaxID=103232 RepID=L1L8C6_9ACTN|nr:class I SAM-dependent methyltransferase [Streptomyces ipomoeae]EKX69271.1 methyltransferase domain protein [Streptomyces ipomoeae 91-03]TQE35618.1 class I SAM-dependent methyltransferase [Streptomyces ipomoeae]TQE38764.1 class I SAM-dependent methyltransferase [Streptomyces ipomoeae]